MLSKTIRKSLPVLLIFPILLIIMSGIIQAQVPVPEEEISPEILNNFWPAYWITCPDVAQREYGVYHFRKTFQLENVPDDFIVHLSADNRYMLYVNGNYVTYGPARGDLQHWRYESINIASQLVKGDNSIAVVVWNFGEHIPFSQMTNQTGFIMAGNGPLESVVNTNTSWMVVENESYSPITGFREHLGTFIVVGPGDRVDGHQYPWGWERTDYDDSGWLTPRILVQGKPRKVGTDGDWMLVPRQIDLMQLKLEPFESLRRMEGINFEISDLNTGRDVQVPANAEASFLLDQGYLTKSYPRLIISKGENASVRLNYAEALFDENGRKGNRDVIEGKKLVGNYDVFISDGGEARMYMPLWFRTYRYVRVDIKTENEPLLVHQILSSPTGFPLKQNSSFDTGDKRLSEIWDVGFRTAQLCAAEIYYDCPYYEQMQYVGDTRIQALISLYVDGNDKLMRKSIDLFNDSRVPIGLTQSRYPSSSMQLIPPYSLFWIDMIHDYWMYRDDPGFVRSYLLGIRNVLYWFEQRLAENGMLGPLEWWNFVDWAEEWPWNPEKGVGGVPYGVAEGGSSNITLQMAYALDRAAELHEHYGEEQFADQYRELSAEIKRATYKNCWDEDRQLMADSPDKTHFSQHANIFAILVDAVPGKDQPALMDRILSEKELIQSTMYFRFYLFEALRKTGKADLYLEQLDPWHTMLEKGLTTFAEKPDPTRSDCHAWSASPNYDFLATVCGILPSSPGFKTVKIEPHPGDLENVEGKLYLPQYDEHIEVKLQKKDGRLKATVRTPRSMTGTFIWEGKKVELEGGKQRLKF